MFFSMLVICALFKLVNWQATYLMIFVKHTKIPWRQLRGLRNIYAHNYQDVDYDLAWSTLIDDLPQIKEECMKLLCE